MDTPEPLKTWNSFNFDMHVAYHETQRGVIYVYIAAARDGLHLTQSAAPESATP